MKKSLLLFALLLWVGVQTVMAQTKAKGKIVDQNGEGIPGAAIKVSGTTTGTQTDVDGNFEIDVPEGSKLIVSAMGFGEQTLTPSENMNISLNQGENIITEVVVTNPYGPTTTKEKYVGAADVITSKQIEKMPVSDITKAIEGAAPGVQVTNGTGQPGQGAAIRVRGQGSISGGTSPLIVLDGTPYDGDITSINPMDVGSMTILKDASATSLYGSRGSNGVIVITTKRGQKGKPRITVDGKVGTVTQALSNYNVMTSEKDYYEEAFRAQYNALVTAGNKAPGATAAGQTANPGIVDQLGYNSYHINGVESALQNAFLLDTFGHLNPNAQLKYHDDWLKEMQRTGFRQDYNFNIAGAGEKTDYYLSAGYLNEQGYLLNSGYHRFTTRLNVNTQANDWLRVGMNVSAALSQQKGYSNTSGESSGNPNYVGRTTAPIYPVYYRDTLNNKVIDPYDGSYKYDYGSLQDDPNYSMGTRPANPNSNIVGTMQLSENKANLSNVTVAPYLEAKFLKEFTFTTRLNASYYGNMQTNWQTGLHGQFKAQGGALTKYADNIFSYTWNQNLGWQHTFNKDHELSVNLVHENYYWNESYVLGNNTGFPNEDFRDLAVATGTPSTTSKTDNERIESYLALANYAYKGKYLLNANFRRDGLSRFSPDSRWGNFYGVGAGWIISQENFMKNVSWVSSLKLKASYGTQGNSQVNTAGLPNYYAYQGLYDISRPNGTNQAAIFSQLPNNTLTWESQKQTNVGVEFSLFTDRLSGEVNLFNRATNGLYYNIPTSPSLGIRSRLDNSADMYNRGIELNLFITAVKTRSFTWTINPNFTTYKNRVTSLAKGVDSFVTGNYMYKPGHDINSFYLVHSAGVDPNNGDELYAYTDANGKDTVTSVYSDANATGRKFVGSATPKFSGAITNNFSFKGFELSFLFTYSVGGKYYDGIYQGLMGSNGEAVGATNWSKDIEKSWSVTNKTATIPRHEYQNIDIGQNSDRWLIDASYLSLRNINLRYTLPTSLVSKAGFSSMSAYIAADNIALWSKRKGMNPQANFTGGGTADAAYLYVPARTIMVGLTLGL